MVEPAAFRHLRTFEPGDGARLVPDRRVLRLVPEPPRRGRRRRGAAPSADGRGPRPPPRPVGTHRALRRLPATAHLRPLRRRGLGPTRHRRRCRLQHPRRQAPRRLVLVGRTEHRPHRAARRPETQRARRVRRGVRTQRHRVRHVLLAARLGRRPLPRSRLRQRGAPPARRRSRRAVRIECAVGRRPLGPRAGVVADRRAAGSDPGDRSRRRGQRPMVGVGRRRPRREPRTGQDVRVPDARRDHRGPVGAVSRHRGELLPQPRRACRAPPVGLRHRGVAHRGRRQGRAPAVEHRSCGRRHHPGTAAGPARIRRAVDPGAPGADRPLGAVGLVGRRRGPLPVPRRPGARRRPLGSRPVLGDHARSVPGLGGRTRGVAGPVQPARRRTARRCRTICAGTAGACRARRRRVGVPTHARPGGTTRRAVRAAATPTDPARPAPRRCTSGRHRAARRRHLSGSDHRAGRCDRARTRRWSHHDRRRGCHGGGAGTQRPARTPPGRWRTEPAGVVPVPGGRGPRAVRHPARVPRRRSRDRARRRRGDPGDHGIRRRGRRRRSPHGVTESVPAGCDGTSASI